MSPAGRRPGPQNTRSTIIDAARHEFILGGYADTTIRSFARPLRSTRRSSITTSATRRSCLQRHAGPRFRPPLGRGYGDAGGNAPFDGTRLAEDFLTRFESTTPRQGFVAGTGGGGVARSRTGDPRVPGWTDPDHAAGGHGGDSWGQRHAMVAAALIGTVW